MKNAGRDLPGVPPKIKVRPEYILHRKTRGQPFQMLVYCHVFQILKQRRTLVPGCVRAAGNNVIAVAGTYGNELRLGGPDPSQEIGELIAKSRC